jgi:tRNA-dihydrouridine synthase 3
MSPTVLDAAGKLGKILVGMNRALGEIPLTIKLRTGVKEGRNNAHKLMPRIGAEWNVAAMTVSLHAMPHQHAARDADDSIANIVTWADKTAAIHKVSRLGIHQRMRPSRSRTRSRRRLFVILQYSPRDISDSRNCKVPRIPIFGGGDAFSAEDYWSKVESSGVDGVMIARGALIKPWIFTEIKERREWDISSRERLELIRKVGLSLDIRSLVLVLTLFLSPQYAEFGLECVDVHTTPLTISFFG